MISYKHKVRYFTPVMLPSR